MNFEEMKKEFGGFKMDGKTFILLNQAHIEGPAGSAHYEANAVSPCDEKDEYGLYPCYEVRWSILPETLEYWKNGGEDEGDACDWNNPESVREIAGYDMDSGRIV